jgi:hypothetical protein
VATFVNLVRNHVELSNCNLLWAGRRIVYFVYQIYNCKISRIYLNILRKIQPTIQIIKLIQVLNQAWAILRYLVATIYLDMKRLLPGAEILYSRTIYSLEINSRTKKFVVPTCDLQAGLIVLGEDLVIQ